MIQVSVSLVADIFLTSLPETTETMQKGNQKQMEKNGFLFFVFGKTCLYRHSA